MSSEVVRRQLLVSIGSLNLPLDRAPSEAKVAHACDAARLLRNRLLREHTRITSRIEALRQADIYDQIDSEEEDAEEAGNYDYQGVARSEFVFVSEMLTAEKLVVPVLLAHGLQFPSTLLPQFLKLLAAVLAPVPRFSDNETRQKDLLRHIKDRCGTDDFFAMLVECVARIAAKRSEGNLQRDDVVLLEVVLTVLTRLIDGTPRESESIVGAFCRNHGLELLLVVVNQNFSKFRNFENAVADAATTNDDKDGTDEILQALTGASPGNGAVGENSVTGGHHASHDSVATIDITDDDGQNSDDDNGGDLTNKDNSGALGPLHLDDFAWDKQFKQRMQKLLESDAQLWKWNTICMETIANILACVPASELAQIGYVAQSTATSAKDVLDRLRNSQGFVDCKKERDNWRCIARSRNGAMNSNGILVRADPNRLDASAVGGRAIGSVSALLGTKRKDPLETLKDLDLRKKGRFIKGMYQDSTPRCNLPLPTKIQLSQQSESFLCMGFEPLSAMMWPALRKDITEIERATLEYREVVAGYKSSGEKMEVTTPLDASLCEKVSHVLDYMTVCASFLHYMREVVRLMMDDKVPFSATSFQQQWQSVSTVISLEHFESGFIMLRSFLYSRDLRRRLDITLVVNFLAELLLALNLLLEGTLVNDPSVEVAAHALASSVLYKEDNIKAVFDVLGEYSSRSIPVQKAQALTLFTAAVFQLIEKCSYKGSLLLPKKENKKSSAKVVTEAIVDDEDDRVSIASSEQRANHDDETNSLADMINDEEDEDDEEGEHTEEKDNADGRIVENAVPDAVPSADVEESASIFPTDDVTTKENESQAGLQSTLTPEHDVDAAAEALLLDHQDTFVAADDTMNRDDVSQARAPSEASLASSRRTALSAISSEREVAVSSYIRRLATPKNVGLIYSTLRHWRTNDADVNLGLTYLMESLVKDGCAPVFFNIAFLLLMREVLAYGQKTHAPLYSVCDQLVFDFFNPPYAKSQDAYAATRFNAQDLTVLRGAQSFLGYEVSLRCSRSLFNFTATDYSLLEEKGMPHLMDHIVIPLPGEQVAAAPAPTTHTAAEAIVSEEEERQMVEAIAKEIERAERKKHKKRSREEKESKKESKKRKKERKERKEKKKKHREANPTHRVSQSPEEEAEAPADQAIDRSAFADFAMESDLLEEEKIVLAE